MPDLLGQHCVSSYKGMHKKARTQVPLLRSLLIAVPVAISVPVHAAIESESAIRWDRYVDSQSGTSVDVPTNIFLDDGPAQHGSGRQFASKDERARLAVYSLPNTDRTSPASYLKKHLTVNTGVFDYRRITSRFFVVSGVRRGVVYYSRCNFRGAKLNCMYIQYPQNEKRAWDGIVTRMSLSLR